MLTIDTSGNAANDDANAENVNTAEQEEESTATRVLNAENLAAWLDKLLANLEASKVR